MAPLIDDGDSFWLRGEHIRLFGVDAPELSQPCLNYMDDCGEKAKEYLQSILNSPVCIKVAMDVYKRTIAICRSGELDIGAEMVRSGHAIALGKFYRSLQVEVNFINPKEFRDESKRKKFNE